MAKRKYGLTEKKIAKYIKEGRGQGIGNEYIPWIKVQDVPSQGRISRVKSWKTQRVHHFLSDLETKYFYYLEWQDDVIDIREQYPLIDRSLCMEIAADNNIQYPRDPRTQTPIIMTSDFMITKIYLDKREEHIVRTAKYANALEDERTLQKLFIEKEYYNIKNIDWGIVTEEIIPEILVNNIRWAHKAYNLQDIICDDISREKSLFFRYKFIESLNKEENRDKSVKEIIDLLEKKYVSPRGTFLYIFKNCIINKIIKINMYNDININNTISSMSIRGD